MNERLGPLVGPMLTALVVAWVGVLSVEIARRDMSAEAAILLGRGLGLGPDGVQVARTRLHPLGQLYIDQVRLQRGAASARASRVVARFDPWQARRGRPRPIEVTAAEVTLSEVVPSSWLRIERASWQDHGGGRSRAQAHGLTVALAGGAAAPGLSFLHPAPVRVAHVGAELQGAHLLRLAVNGLSLSSASPRPAETVDLLLLRERGGYSLRGALTGAQGMVLLPAGEPRVTAELDLQRLMLPSLSGSMVDLSMAQLTGQVAVSLEAESGRSLPEALRAGRGALWGRANLHAAHLGLNLPLLAEVPLPDLDLTLDGEVFLTRGADGLRLSMQQLRLGLGAAQLSLLASVSVQSLEGPAPDYRAEVEIRLRPILCGQLLSALPRALLPRLDGLGVSGDIGGGLRLSLESRTLPAVATRNDIEVRCKVTSDPPQANVAQVLDPGLVLTRQGEDGQTRRLPLGPTAPGADQEPGFQPLRELPWPVVRAFLVAEDNLFFLHHGFDVQMLVRALGLNLQEQRALRGASTISQQLVKNLWLRQERAVGRKLEEAVLTWRLEQVVSKERILEVYLNLVELGSGIYGVSMAARHYFGIPASKLTVEQAAQLAALLPAPRRGMDAAWTRRYHELLPRLQTAPVPRGRATLQ